MKQGQSGVTLFELTIYLTILVVIGGQLAQLVRVSVRSSRESDAINKVTERNRSTLIRLGSEVRACIGSSVSITGGGDILTFTKADGYEGVSIINGSTIRYSFVNALGETANAEDDNGNGLVDEGRLFREDLTNGTSFAVCEGLDLSECSFTTSGDAVTIGLSSKAFLPDSETVMSIDRDFTVYPRN
jgi:hypothetical protein